MKVKSLLLVVLVFALAIILSGCEATITTNEGPNASFSANQISDYAPSTVEFTDQSSDDGEIVSRKWKLGDGSTKQGGSFSHTYQDDGTYQVTLTVTDDFGATAKDTTNIKVLNPPPTPSFTYSPREPLIHETINFDAGNSYDPASVKPHYIKQNGFRWYFGDGNTGNGMTVSKSYDEPGYYEVTLETEDDDGAISSVTREIKVEAAPEPYFSWKIVEIAYSSTSKKAQPQLEPQVRKAKIRFNANASYDNKSIQKYKWNFGDGSYEATQYSQTTHWFNWPRNTSYQVTLTVVDNEGLTTSLTKTISS